MGFEIEVAIDGMAESGGGVRSERRVGLAFTVGRFEVSAR
jgi:hypothetical protein